MTRRKAETRWPWRDHLEPHERAFVADHERTKAAVKSGKRTYATIVQRAVDRARAAAGASAGEGRKP